MEQKGAQINISALIDFNKTLEKFSSQMKDAAGVMKSSIDRLGNEWKDDKYTEFKNEFDNHLKKLQPLAEELKKYKDHSENHWIPIIEKFLNNKM